MDVFDSYFKRADLDQDGRISGAEAVAFLQGSNLPKQVLAQIWAYANQNQTDYLGRPEFYNALRLVTVAQSGRDLTPDIVKTALGPAAAQIPAPKINHVSVPSASGHANSMAIPATQSNSMMPPTPQMGAAGPSSLQNLGVRGHQAMPNMSMSRPIFPSLNNNLTRPPQGMPTVASLPMQGVGQGLSGGASAFGSHFAVTNRPNLSTDWLGGRTSGVTAEPTSQPPNRGIAPINQERARLGQLGMNSGATPKPQAPALSSSVQPPVNQVLLSSQPSANDSRALAISGNGSPSDSVFGGDIFSAMPRAKPDSSTPSFSAISLPMSSNMSSGFQNPTKTGLPDSLHGTRTLPHGGSQQKSQVKQNQLGTPQTMLTLASNVSVGPLTPSSGDSQVPWPKITQSDIQKYTKVFVEVDKDRDGKITGEQARNLFLSWRLPREVLMLVWDLSDEDNDSMLSLREFCTALYLLERYREGRPLPAVLPNSLRFDETLLLSTGQPSSAYGGSAWQQNPGLPHQGAPGPRPVTNHSAMKPPRAPLPPVPEDMVQPQQQKAKVPELEKHLVNQLSEEEQKSINSKFQEATEADKKVKELEKEILESREKNEFYRSKMQELVLYKSRCDNRLNEITERVSADKREVESLARKYEDKYKQVGDVASKLTLDEATFRDIQERKLELYNAIVKMEQGGTAEGVLQDRINKIQSDLEELVKTLNERCKQYGLRAKPASLVELPFGWQPGIQEGAADWDEDWDKFNDEGYAIIKELTVEVENIVAKPKLPLVRSDKTSAAEVSTLRPSSNDENKNETGKGEVSTVLSSYDDENKNETGKGEVTTGSSSSNGDKKIETEKSSDNGEPATDDESAYAHSENGSGRSPHGTPRRSTVESSSPEFQSRQFGMHDLSLHSKENQSDHGGAETTLSGDRCSDEPSWDAKFDIDDADSMWGLSTINTKLTDHDKARHDSFFGPGDFGLNPIRTGSLNAESVSGTERKSPFFDSVPSTPQYKSPFFDSVPNTPQYKSSLFDSVPSTPQYNSSFSPRFSEGPEDHAFDRFSQFDSFSMNDGGLFPPRESFSRFDSMRSTTDPPSLARFDSMRSMTDAPSFGGLSRFDSMNNKADPPPFGSLARFDSIRSTSDHGGGFLSFDDADPFGSTGPFKSSEGQTPKRSDDSWSAF